MQEAAINGRVLARVIAWPRILDRRWFTAEGPTHFRTAREPCIVPSIFKHCKYTQRVRRDMQTYCLQQFRRVAAQTPARSFSTSASLRRAFKEGDVVLLREKKELVDGKLVKLQASKSIHTHRGVIEHATVIGKEPRQIVRSSKGSEYRVLTPTLAEYVRLTPRLVTPVRLSSPEHAL